MAERFNSNAAPGESGSERAVITPAGETILQLKAEDPRAKVDVMVRVDTGADWEAIATLDRHLNIFVRLPQFPSLKLVTHSNTAGKTISVRDNT